MTKHMPTPCLHLPVTPFEAEVLKAFDIYIDTDEGDIANRTARPLSTVRRTMSRLLRARLVEPSGSSNAVFRLSARTRQAMVDYCVARAALAKAEG